MRTDIQVDIPKGDMTKRRSAVGHGRRDTPELERFKQVTKEFESLLVETMVKEMRTGDMKSTLFGKDSGMETYRDMLDGEYVRLMTERGGIGLSDFMVRNTPPELMGKDGTAKKLQAVKNAGQELDRVSSFAGSDRQSLQTGLPTPGAWGVNKRPGD
jgi:Rod binding domain-containing protein